jgi:hypothetical protein
MNTKLIHGIAVLSMWIAAGYCTAHDLIGLDAERQRKAKALENLTNPPARKKPAKVETAASPGQVPNVSPVLSKQLTDVKSAPLTMNNRNRALIVVTDMANRNAGIPGAVHPQTLYSIRSIAKTWNAGTTLKVCFFDGDPVTRGFVAAYATEWTAHGNVAFDFGPRPEFRRCVTGDDSAIRVTFASGGWQSAVGNDSLYYASQGQPSMYLEGLDGRDLSLPDYRFVILHEFGHALGFEHEHQSPFSVCEAQFDMQVIQQELTWPMDRVLANFQQLHVSSAHQVGNYLIGTTSTGDVISVSPYDAKSVMHYSLPGEYFIQPPGSCYVPLNAELSEQDIKAMADAYPYADPAAINASHNAKINALLSDPRLGGIEKSALSALKR